MRIKIMVFMILLLNAIAFAQNYPSTCPSEAQGILEAVGGCAAVDCTKFPAICQKCCTQSTNATQQLPLQTENVNVVAIAAVLVIILVIGLMVWSRGKTKRIHKRK